MNKSYIFFIILFIIILFSYKYKHIFNKLYFIPKTIFFITSIMFLILPRHTEFIPDLIINNNLNKCNKNTINKLNILQDLDIIDKQKILNKQKNKCIICKKVILNNEYIIKYKLVNKEKNKLSNYFLFCNKCSIIIK